MNKPDPVQHMMVWGAISSSFVLMCYFLLAGTLALPNISSWLVALLAAGIFGGLSLGGMSGVIIGMVFQHDQDDVTVTEVRNRRNTVIIAVFMMVFFVSRILLVMAFGLVGHPLALSLLGAIVAALASQHYLYRVESWLKIEKRKRKNDDLPQRLLDDVVPEEQDKSHNTQKRRDSNRFR